jgi:signal transduction histidine kinase/ActR/RegA family two-component response regulator
VASLLRAAARGDSLERLAPLAARELLKAGNADRAGIWFLKESDGGPSRTLEGVMMESGGSFVPEHWMSLDPSLPELLELLEGNADEVLLRDTRSASVYLSQLTGTAKALWLPLRVGNKPFGLALAAWRDEASPIETSPLRALADAMALAAGEWRFRGSDSGHQEVPGAWGRMRARALEAEAQLASVAEATDVGILLFDANENVRLMNDRFVQLLGITRQVLAGAGTWTSLAQVVSGQFSEPAAFLEQWRELAEHPADASCDELKFPPPSSRRLERFARPVLGGEGGFLGRLEVYRDVTGQEAAQSKLLQTEKMAGLGQLVSGIAHELNNPLTSIMGYSQLLLGRRLTPSQAADGRLIYQEAERAARIVKNLLLFARDSRPERRAVNLNDVAQRTLALRNYELRLENIELAEDFDPQLPPVIGDAAQLQQVLLNLLVNSEQAIRQGMKGGRIAISTRVTPRGRVSFEIADTGPGIPEEIIPRIFDPFFSTKPPGAGTGLGLSIAYSIIQEYGGEISVDSKPGHGAKFTIDLAVARGESPAARAPVAKRHSTVDARCITRSARVLVIEDEPSVAHLIADVLAEEGHPVEIVLEGREGLNRAAVGEHDLVICDLRMPNMDGRAIYRELVAKRSPMLDRLVFVTGDTLSPRTMEFLEACGVPFLAKPFLVEELKAVVVQALTAAEHSSDGNGNTRRSGKNVPQEKFR